MSLTFEFPLPANHANARASHWKGRHFRRKAYWALLDDLVTTRQNPKPPKRPWPKAEAVIQMRTWRRADTDNCHSRCKDVFDWLQTRGYLVNDRDLTYQLDARTAPRNLLGITLTLRQAA